jgi:6-pyruvoyltetrahydropterin/6-carboxytetrahydropterin synthase
MAKYLSTKTYGNDRGLSCCFRQWKSTHSHCAIWHGYSIGIKLIFESETLDSRNWVMDFGGLKAFKEWSEYMFDHTLIVSSDDPHLNFFIQMSQIVTPEVATNIDSEIPHERGAICDLRIVDGVGCEMFARMAYLEMEKILNCYKEGVPYTTPNGKTFSSRYPVGKDVKLKSAEVFEHSANSAIYEG